MTYYPYVVGGCVAVGKRLNTRLPTGFIFLGINVFMLLGRVPVNYGA